MITVTVTGSQTHRGPKVSKIVMDALVGSRLIVRYFPNGRPAEFPNEGNDEIINVIDETKEVK